MSPGLDPIPFAAPLAMTPTAPRAVADTNRERVDLGELFERHGRRLYRLARRLSRGAAEAEDLVQETFLRAARALSSVPLEAAPAEGWLVRTLVRLAHDRFRRRRVRDDAVPELVHALAEAADPAGAAIARHDVGRALAALPPRRRVVVVLHELEERDTAEIARLLGIARVTVRWHLAAGRRELGRRLGRVVRPEKEMP